jgi:hypothetical protein
MQIEEHLKRVEELAAQLSEQQRALFCLACAERLAGCCWAFARGRAVPLAPFFDWMEQLALAAATDAWGTLDLLAASAELDAVVPMSDDDGSPLAIQAQAGVICLLSAIAALQGAHSACRDSAMGVIDAIDNYVMRMHEHVFGNLSGPDDSLLMDRELALQLSDLSFLRTLEQPPGNIAAWRERNLQFAIPIAFGPAS